jgi:hypothetical protein
MNAAKLSKTTARGFGGIRAVLTQTYGQTVPEALSHVPERALRAVGAHRGNRFNPAKQTNRRTIRRGRSSDAPLSALSCSVRVPGNGRNARSAGRKNRMSATAPRVVRCSSRCARRGPLTSRPRGSPCAERAGSLCQLRRSAVAGQIRSCGINAASTRRKHGSAIVPTTDGGA